MLYYIILYYTILYYIILHYIVDCMRASNIQCRAWNFAPQKTWLSKHWSPLWVLWLRASHDFASQWTDLFGKTCRQGSGSGFEASRLRNFHHVQESRGEQMITDGLMMFDVSEMWWKSSVHQPEMLVMTSVFQYTVCICNIHVFLYMILHVCLCWKKARVLVLITSSKNPKSWNHIQIPKLGVPKNGSVDPRNLVQHTLW